MELEEIKKDVFEAAIELLAQAHMKGYNECCGCDPSYNEARACANELIKKQEKIISPVRFAKWPDGKLGIINGTNQVLWSLDGRFGVVPDFATLTCSLCQCELVKTTIDELEVDDTGIAINDCLDDEISDIFSYFKCTIKNGDKLGVTWSNDYYIDSIILDHFTIYKCVPLDN